MTRINDTNAIQYMECSTKAENPICAKKCFYNRDGKCNRYLMLFDLLLLYRKREDDMK